MLNFNVNPPCTNVKPPRTNVKPLIGDFLATVLIRTWRRQTCFLQAPFNLVTPLLLGGQNRYGLVNCQLMTKLEMLHMYAAALAHTQAWASEGGWQGGLAPTWILTILAKKGCFLSFEWEKTYFTIFGPLHKFCKNPLVAPSGKIFQMAMYPGFPPGQ